MSQENNSGKRKYPEFSKESSETLRVIPEKEKFGYLKTQAPLARMDCGKPTSFTSIFRQNQYIFKDDSKKPKLEYKQSKMASYL